MFLIAFILSYALVDVQSNERIYPSNTAVIAGKQFSLVCENHSDGITPMISWRFLRVGTSTESLVYNGTHLSHQFGDFQVHSTADGISNLTKNISKIDDAGIYRCIQKYGSNYVRSSAQVIVLATAPVCSPKEIEVLKGQYFELNCSVQYSGSPSPNIKWSIGDRIDSTVDTNITSNSSRSSMISTLKMYATRKDNNETFKCTTYFNQPKISSEDQTSERKATNAPTYEHQCTHRLNVLSEPDVVEVTPKKDFYTLGDVLLCNANGNPTPTYEWTELGSNRVVSKGSSLTVDSTAMENHAYKCTATSNAAGKERNISTTVTIHAVIGLSSEIDGRSTLAVRSITIVAGVICGILMLMIFAVVVKRFKVLEWLSSFMQREGDHGPDIVQNADEIEDERLAVNNENGYAQPEDLRLGVCISRNERKAIPVYSEVNKGSAVVAGHSSGAVIPVYGKVQKKRDEKAACPEHASSVSNADDGEFCHEWDSGPTVLASTMKQIVGVDSIEYMDIGEVRSLAPFGTSSSTARPPLFQRSHYAEIDHTKPIS